MQWVLYGHKSCLEVNDKADKKVFIKCLEVAWSIVRVPI